MKNKAVKISGIFLSAWALAGCGDPGPDSLTDRIYLDGEETVQIRRTDMAELSIKTDPARAVAAGSRRVSYEFTGRARHDGNIWVCKEERELPYVRSRDYNYYQQMYGGPNEAFYLTEYDPQNLIFPKGRCHPAHSPS